jgi:hypothetical protein
MAAKYNSVLFFQLTPDAEYTSDGTLPTIKITDRALRTTTWRLVRSCVTKYSKELNQSLTSGSKLGLAKAENI